MLYILSIKVFLISAKDLGELKSTLGYCNFKVFMKRKFLLHYVKKTFRNVT